MGFFSWLTADTQESIPNMYSNKPMKTVYLLLPDGQKPIAEPCYEGYGEFGGQDAYVVLATMNKHLIPNFETRSEESLRSLAIHMDCGKLVQDVKTGQLWSIFHHFDFPNIKRFKGCWDDIIPEYGKSPNKLLAEGRFKAVKTKDVIKGLRPLKFSFDPNAVWEDLPASKRCPYQGYFY